MGFRKRIAKWIYPEIFEHYYYANKRAEKLDNHLDIIGDKLGITKEQIEILVIKSFTINRDNGK